VGPLGPCWQRASLVSTAAERHEGVEPVTERLDELVARARATKGFMPDDEGLFLYAAALRAGHGRRSDIASAGGQSARRDRGVTSASGARRGATFVEIGAWCGKSTLYLGAAAESTGAVLFSVDHHHGSEENQPGWDHHDPGVVDPDTGRIDTLGFWRRAVDGASLAASVVAMVGDSPTIAEHWSTPLELCFIDGGHGEEPAWADFRGWARHVAIGGFLAIHDVFCDPADGGRPPYELWLAALDSKEFVEDGECGSLRVLRRISPTSAAR
jgi:MMP 1-O-methyltransferase